LSLFCQFPAGNLADAEWHGTMTESVQKSSKNKLNFDQPALHGGKTPPLTWSKKKTMKQGTSWHLIPKDAEPHLGTSAG